MGTIESLRKRLGRGLVIPACPLALNSRRRLDERRQRALIRYYREAGAGGLAVGVHTTQFAIRNPEIALFKPVLELAAHALSESLPKNTARSSTHPVRIAGICGLTPQALAEARLARDLGYEAGLLSLGALKSASESVLLTHCKAVASELPVIGFYLQPSVGGRLLPYSFWRRFAEIENVVAIKIAPFNRFQTLDVIRAIAESGREDIALYTGNDDAIVADLLTPFRFQVAGKVIERRIVGGLLGHWAVWTRRAVELHAQCQAALKRRSGIPQDLLARSVNVTDMNAALFDAANAFAGCIPGIHEILRRQGLLDGTWCLDSSERLSAGQSRELDRVCAAYPELTDDAFVAQHLDRWLNS
jgi:dihydrodipicolinate synthase/N-acetylneuraminate lyase